MYASKDDRRLSGRADEPRVGTVTKLYPTFGYINDEIFFQRRCVIGPMVNVGDTVAANATFHPDLPIKWNAEQVWRIEPDHTDDRRNVRLEPQFSRPLDHRSSRKDRPSDHRHEAERRLIAPPVYLYKVKCAWQDSFPMTQPFQSSKEVRFHQVNKMAVRLVNVEDHSYQPNPAFAVGVLLLSCPPPSELYERCVASAPESKIRPLTKCISMLTASRDGLRAIGGDWIPELDGTDPVSNPQTLVNTAIRTCKDEVGLDLSGCTRWYRFLEFRYSRSEGQSWPSVNELFGKGGQWGAFEDSRQDSQRHRSRDSTVADEKSARSSKVQPPEDRLKSDTEPIAASSSPAAKKTENSVSSPSPHTPEDSDFASSHRVVVYFVPDIWSIMPDTEQWEKIKSKYQDPKSYVACDQKSDTVKSDLATPTSTSVEANGIATNSPTSDSSGMSDGQTCSQLKQEATETEEIRANAPGVVGDTDSGSSGAQAEPPAVQEGSAANGNPRLMHHSKIDINVLKVSELREQLSLRKLDTSGLKAQLFARLKAALESEAEHEAARQKLEEEEKAARKAAANAALAESAAEKGKTGSATEAPKGTAAPTATTATESSSVPDRPEPKLPVLPEQPSLVVQLKQDAPFSLVVCSLETIITLSKGHYKPCNQVYELFVCANHILHMLHRDATFTFYKALVVLSDRKQLKSTQDASRQTKSVSEQPSKKPRTSVEQPTEASQSTFTLPSYIKGIGGPAAAPMPQSKIVDLPLLFACKLLDYSDKGSFSMYNVESIVNSLCLPISRYQVRALSSNVASSSKCLFYRSLTDSPATKEDTGAGKLNRAPSKRSYEQVTEDLNELIATPLSLIDDEEYLEELVRGGDAILDEEEESHLQAVPPVIFCGMQLKKDSDVDTEAATKTEFSTADNFLRQLRKLENDCLRLEENLKTRELFIESLKTENEEIPKLREKLKKMTSTADHYKNRCHERRAILSSTLQQLESQACILETTVHSLRSGARKLKRDLYSNESSSTSRGDSRRSESRTSSVAPVSNPPTPTLPTVQEKLPETRQTTLPASDTSKQGPSGDPVPTPDQTVDNPPACQEGSGDVEDRSRTTVDINSEDSLDTAP
ncbi:hypothetical protein AAHC03_013033 [Spirometra sp. Aus1]